MGTRSAGAVSLDSSAIGSCEWVDSPFRSVPDGHSRFLRQKAEILIGRWTQSWMTCCTSRSQPSRVPEGCRDDAGQVHGHRRPEAADWWPQVKGRKEMTDQHNSHIAGPGYASPQDAIHNAPKEEVLYVAGLYTGTGVPAPDFLAVVDVNP